MSLYCVVKMGRLEFQHECFGRLKEQYHLANCLSFIDLDIVGLQYFETCLCFKHGG
jgi:hypothetical protein